MAVIQKTLALSTANLPRSLGERGLADLSYLAVDSIEGGWFVWVPEHASELGGHVVPLPLLHVLAYAKDQDCRFIHLHCDNDIDPALPSWDW